MTNVHPLIQSVESKTTADTEAAALAAVKARYVRVRSSTSYPRFRDLESNQDNSDTAFILDYYRKKGGSKLGKDELVAKLKFISHEVFQPGKDKILPGGILNIWDRPELVPSGAKPSKDDVAPFIEFLERLFPEKAERDYFGKWMAWTIRYPDQPINTTPVLRSEQGVGKSFFGEHLMPALLGKNSAVVCLLQDIARDFNEVIEGKTFVLIDEVYKTKKRTADVLKPLLANGTIQLRRKGLPTITVDNYINFIITSNDYIPLTIEKGDRRYWVPKFIKHRVDSTETNIFIAKVFVPWLESGGFQKVRDYLENVDLSGFSPTAPAPFTASKEELLGFTTADKLEALLPEIMEGRKVVLLKEVKEEADLHFDHVLNEMTVVSALAAAGCQIKRSKAKRYYITPLGLEAGLSKNTPPKELEQHLT